MAIILHLESCLLHRNHKFFLLRAEYTFNKGKIGGDFSLSHYDVNLFSSKNNDQNTGFAGRIFGNKIFTKNNWNGTVGAEFQRISSQFHILDRINDVEFSRDFNLTQEFNQITQNRLIFSFLNSWKNTNFINYKLNYLNEKQSYNGIKNDLDFKFLKKNTETRGNFSYLNTTFRFSRYAICKRKCFY